MESLGQKIRRLRKERRLTQQGLAEGLVTPSMISQIESDRATPSERVLGLIAERLQVDAGEFLQDVIVKADLVQTYRKARSLMDLDQHDEAIPLLQSLLDPVAPQFKEQSILQDLADCYEQLHKDDETSEVLRRMAEIAHEKEDVESAIFSLYRLGRLERRRNQLPMARKYLLAASNVLFRHPEVVMPLSLRVYLTLGRVCLSLDLVDEALEAYGQAYSLSNHYGSDVDKAMINHGIAELLLEIGAFQGASNATERAIHYYEAIHQVRNAHICRLNWAIIERRRNRHEEALAMLSGYLKLNDFRRDLHLVASNLAERVYNLLAMENYQEAIDVAGHIQDEYLEPNDKVTLYASIAKAYDCEGLTEEALASISEAADVAERESLTEPRQHVTLLRDRMVLLDKLKRREEALQTAKQVAFAVQSRKTSWDYRPACV